MLKQPREARENTGAFGWKLSPFDVAQLGRVAAHRLVEQVDSPILYTLSKPFNAAG